MNRISALFFPFFFFIAACSASTPAEKSSPTDAGADTSPRAPLPGYESCKQDPTGCPVVMCDCPPFYRYPITSRRDDGTCNLNFEEVCVTKLCEKEKPATPVTCIPKNAPVDSGKTCDFSRSEVCPLKCFCKGGDIITGADPCKSDGTCATPAEKCPAFCAGFGGWAP